VALVNHLLNPSVDDKGSFMSMTRVAHRFAFPLEYFPFHVRRSVRSGMPFAVPLLRLVRDRNAERGNPMLSIKPMDKHVRSRRGVLCVGRVPCHAFDVCQTYTHTHTHGRARTHRSC